MKSRLIGSLVLAVAAFWAPLSHAYSLFLSTDPAAVLPGQSFKVGVNIDDAGDLASFQFSLSFDATRVQLGTPDFSVSGTLIDPAGGSLVDPVFPFDVTVIPGVGTLDVFADSLEGLISAAGGGLLLALNFEVPSSALAPFTTEFSLNAAALGFNRPPDPNTSWDPDLSNARASTTIRTQGGGLVPEPAGLALGALAFALAVMPRRRRPRPH